MRQDMAPRTPPPLASSRRERRKASTRQVLLEAARRLFSEKGLYESRVEEITDFADIGKGTLYRYFRNKEELVLAVVEEGFRELGEAVAARVVGAATLPEMTRTILVAHVDFFMANPDLLRVFHQARGMLKFNREEWRPLRHSLAAHLEGTATHLGRTSEGGRLDAAARLDLAMLLFGSVSGTLSVHAAANTLHAPASLTGPQVAALAALVRPFNGASARTARRRPAGAAARGDRRRRGGS